MKLSRRNFLANTHSGLGHETCIADGRMYVLRTRTGMRLYLDSADEGHSTLRNNTKRRFFITLSNDELKRMLALAPELRVSENV